MSEGAKVKWVHASELMGSKLGDDWVPVVEPPRWIPVSERLPEDGRLVLAFVPDGDLNQTAEQKCYVGELYEGDSGWRVFYYDTFCGSAGPVTHWMPLPEPPKP